MSKIYVGNLSWNTTDESLKQVHIPKDCGSCILTTPQAFSEFGTVLDVRCLNSCVDSQVCS
ncbi:hypothetical protein B0H10DRAFT_2079365 [Mycena sp. CBHHK59/15]|nr:hypothetical protein B0H10DRAFT_2079365 [Mycena sp. CBHHK59/15]